MRKLALLFLALALALTARATTPTSTINTTNQYAWGANIGWTNWRPDPDATNTTGVIIGEFICSGYVYAANVGWINMGNGNPVNHIQYQNNSATDFGVNYGIDSTLPGYGILRGYAYGANIGWINFEATGNPRIDLFTGNLSGYAYSANCGWINLGEIGGHYLQTDHIAMGVDSDGDGIADAWEYLYFGGLSHAGATDTDGDGMSDLQEYLEGTNPTIGTDALRITAYTTNSGGTSSNLTWTSNTLRLYVVETNPDLNPLNWVDSGLGTIAPDAGTTTMRTIVQSSATKRFFRVRSIRPLP
jgi:hypothetical protein